MRVSLKSVTLEISKAEAEQIFENHLFEETRDLFLKNGKVWQRKIYKDWNTMDTVREVESIVEGAGVVLTAKVKLRDAIAEAKGYGKRKTFFI